MKKPQNDSKYIWTNHVVEKMWHYGISEGRIKRIIRFPKRIEEGIVSGTVAVMQPAGSKNYQELWVMYKIDKRRTTNNKQPKITNFSLDSRKIKIITAWRYPGKSPERDPIPQEIISEIRGLL